MKFNSKTKEREISSMEIRHIHSVPPERKDDRLLALYRACLRVLRTSGPKV